MSLRDLQKRFDDRDDRLRRLADHVTAMARRYRLDPSPRTSEDVARAVRDLQRAQGGRP